MQGTSPKQRGQKERESSLSIRVLRARTPGAEGAVSGLPFLWYMRGTHTLMMGGCAVEHRAGRERTELTIREQDGSFGSCSEKVTAGDPLFCIPGGCKVVMGRGRPLRTVIKTCEK